MHKYLDSMHILYFEYARNYGNLIHQNLRIIMYVIYTIILRGADPIKILSYRRSCDRREGEKAHLRGKGNSIRWRKENNEPRNGEGKKEKDRGSEKERARAREKRERERDLISSPCVGSAGRRAPDRKEAPSSSASPVMRLSSSTSRT